MFLCGIVLDTCQSNIDTEGKEVSITPTLGLFWAISGQCEYPHRTTHNHWLGGMGKWVWEKIIKRKLSQQVIFNNQSVIYKNIYLKYSTGKRCHKLLINKLSYKFK